MVVETMGSASHIFFVYPQEWCTRLSHFRISPLKTVLMIIREFIDLLIYQINPLKMPLAENKRTMILILRGYKDKQMSFKKVQNLITDQFRVGQKGTPVSTITKTCRRFVHTGGVKDHSKLGSPPIATNNDLAVEVIQSVVEQSHVSIRKPSRVHGIGLGGGRKKKKQKENWRRLRRRRWIQKKCRRD